MDENNIFEQDVSSERFIIASKPHIKRNDGFPIDSLSIQIESGKYYYDIEEVSLRKSNLNGFKDFFTKSLGCFGIKLSNQTI